MFLETTLLFKTMLILCGQLFIVLGTCFYCIRAARRAYENNTSFAGLYFKGSMNMKQQLDLVPYSPAPEFYPSEMFKQVPLKDNPNKTLLIVNIIMPVSVLRPVAAKNVHANKDIAHNVKAKKI